MDNKKPLVNVNIIDVKIKKERCFDNKFFLLKKNMNPTHMKKQPL